MYAFIYEAYIYQVNYINSKYLFGVRKFERHSNNNILTIYFATLSHTPKHYFVNYSCRNHWRKYVCYKLYRLLTVYMKSYVGYMYSSRVYEPICTVKNLYNDFIILQDVFLTSKVCVFLHIYVEFGIYHKLPQLTYVPRLEPHYTTSERDFLIVGRI